MFWTGSKKTKHKPVSNTYFSSQNMWKDFRRPLFQIRLSNLGQLKVNRRPRLSPKNLPCECWQKMEGVLRLPFGLLNFQNNSKHEGLPVPIFWALRSPSIGDSWLILIKLNLDKFFVLIFKTGRKVEHGRIMKIRSIILMIGFWMPNFQNFEIFLNGLHKFWYIVLL